LFGMDMTPHEGSSDGGSSAKTDLVLATAVDHFHARKFRTKVEKRGAMKVIITGKVKKQKKTIKASMQGALASLDPEVTEAMMN
jgi:hypothetical protein